MKRIIFIIVCVTAAFTGCTTVGNRSNTANNTYFITADIVIAPLDTNTDSYLPDSSRLTRISWRATPDSAGIEYPGGKKGGDTNSLCIHGAYCLPNGIRQHELWVCFGTPHHVHTIPAGTYDLADVHQPLFMIMYSQHDSITQKDNLFALSKGMDGDSGKVQITSSSADNITGTFQASGVDAGDYISMSGTFSVPTIFYY